MALARSSFPDPEGPSMRTVLSDAAMSGRMAKIFWVAAVLCGFVVVGSELQGVGIQPEDHATELFLRDFSSSKKFAMCLVQ